MLSMARFRLMAGRDEHRTGGTLSFGFTPTTSLGHQPTVSRLCRTAPYHNLLMEVSCHPLTLPKCASFAQSSADGNLLRDLDNLLAFCFAVAHGRTVSRVAELAGIEARSGHRHTLSAQPRARHLACVD